MRAHLLLAAAAAAAAAHAELPPHLRLPPLRPAAHPARPLFLAALKDLSDLGEPVPGVLLDAASPLLPPHGHSVPKAASESGGGEQAPSLWLAALPGWLQPVRPAMEAAVAAARSVLGALSPSAQQSSATAEAHTGEAALAKLVVAADAGYAPAITFLAHLRLFGRREVIPASAYGDLAVAVNTSAVAPGKEPAHGSCALFALLHDSGGGGAGGQPLEAEPQQRTEAVLVLRFRSVSDALVALAGATCLAHNELDVLAHHAHTLDTIGEAPLAVAAAAAVNSPLLGAVKAKWRAAEREKAYAEGGRGGAAAGGGPRGHPGHSRRPPSRRSSSGGGASNATGEAHHAPTTPPIPAAPGQPFDPDAQLAADLPGAGGGGYGEDGEYYPDDYVVDGDDAQMMVDEGGYEFGGGGGAGGGLGGRRFGFGGGRRTQDAYDDDDDYDDDEDESGEFFGGQQQPPPEGAAPPPPPPGAPVGPWVTGATAGTFILSPADYEPAALGIYIRRDVLLEPDEVDAAVASADPETGGGGGWRAALSLSSPWDDVIVTYESGLTTLALLHLARVRVSQAALRRALRLPQPLRTDESSSQPSPSPPLPVGDGSDDWAPALAGWLSRALAALATASSSSSRRLVTPARPGTPGASVRLFPSDGAALDVLDALAHRQVGAAQVAVGYRWLHGLPTGTGAVHAVSATDAAANCQRALAHVLPVAQDAANDGAVSSAAHPESWFPLLRELHYDAAAAGASREDEQNIDWLRQTAEGGAPGAPATVDAQLQMGELLLYGYPQAGLRPDPAGAARMFRAAAAAGNVEAAAQLGMMILEGLGGGGHELLAQLGLQGEAAEAAAAAAAARGSNSSSATAVDAGSRSSGGVSGGFGGGGGATAGGAAAPAQPPAHGEGGVAAAAGADAPVGDAGAAPEQPPGAADGGAAAVGAAGEPLAGGVARDSRSGDDATTNSSAGRARHPPHAAAAAKLDPATALAMRYLQDAVDAGSPTALAGLGYAYQTGAGGVRRNLTRAAELLQAAADAGLMGAHSNLAALFLMGDPSGGNSSSRGGGDDDDTPPFNASRARAHLEIAVTTGFAPAHYNLGLIDYYGWDRGGAQNCAAAMAHWVPVAARGRWADEGPFSLESALDQARHGGAGGGGRQSALLQYLALAQLGLTSAMDNAAFLLESAGRGRHWLEERAEAGGEEANDDGDDDAMLLDAYRVAVGYRGVLISTVIPAPAATSAAATMVAGDATNDGAVPSPPPAAEAALDAGDSTAAPPAAPPATTPPPAPSPPPSTTTTFYLDLDEPGAHEPVLTGWLWRSSSYVSSISALRPVMAPPTPAPLPVPPSADAAAGTLPGLPALPASADDAGVAAVAQAEVAPGGGVSVSGASDGSSAALPAVVEPPVPSPAPPPPPSPPPTPPPPPPLQPMDVGRTAAFQLHARAAALGAPGSLHALADCVAHAWRGVPPCEAPTEALLLAPLRVAPTAMHGNVSVLVAANFSLAALAAADAAATAASVPPHPLPLPAAVAVYLYARAALGGHAPAAFALAAGLAAGRLGDLPLPAPLPSPAWSLLDVAGALDERAAWPVAAARAQLLGRWAAREATSSAPSSGSPSLHLLAQQLAECLWEFPSAAENPDGKPHSRPFEWLSRPDAQFSAPPPEEEGGGGGGHHWGDGTGSYRTAPAAAAAAAAAAGGGAGERRYALGPFPLTLPQRRACTVVVRTAAGVGVAAALTTLAAAGALWLARRRPVAGA